MDASVTFFVSFVLLVAFIIFRFFEEKRGARVFAHARKTADSIVSEMYKSAVRGNIPAEYRDAAARFLRTLAHDTVVFLVEGLRAIERPLTRLSYRMRQSAPMKTDKQPSDFLKTITPEKKPEGGDTTNTI